jgi:hypothetical protein
MPGIAITMNESKSSSRRAWRLWAPFGAILVLALAWSGLWLLAAHKAEAVIAAWIEQEARAGRVYACGTRTVGGYPFRIEVRCSDPVMELTSLQPPRTVRGKALVAVAQVYQPGLILAEITGPVSIAETASPAALRADWRLAQASLGAVGRRPERLSIVLDDVRLERMDGVTAEALGGAKRVEVGIHRNASESGAMPPVDFAATIAGAMIPAGPLGGKPIDGETAGVLRGLSDFKPMPMSARLKEWQMAGGRLELTRLRLQQGEAVAIAAGDIGLVASGRPDGTFSITMAGFDQVVREIVRGGGLQVGLIAGLTFLGRPAEIDGRRAIAVPLRIKDGSMSLGPIPLGKLDPLF